MNLRQLHHDLDHDMYLPAKRKSSLGKKPPGKVPSTDPFPRQGTQEQKCEWMRRKHGKRRGRPSRWVTAQQGSSVLKGAR